jgi:hypothetical protein
MHRVRGRRSRRRAQGSNAITASIPLSEVTAHHADRQVKYLRAGLEAHQASGVVAKE